MLEPTRHMTPFSSATVSSMPLVGIAHLLTDLRLSISPTGMEALSVYPRRPPRAWLVGVQRLLVE